VGGVCWLGWQAYLWAAPTGAVSIVLVAAVALAAVFFVDTAGASAGAFGGAIAGIVSASAGTNPIGLVGFVCFLIFVGPLPGAARKSVAAISFGAAAAATSFLFTR